MPQVRVNVFRRADGVALYDGSFSTGAVAPKSSAVWEVVRVLLQIAREVGGGAVRSVSFRAADAPPDARAFGVLRSRPPIAVAVAHGDLFAVTAASTLSERSRDHNAQVAKDVCHRIHEFILADLVRHPQEVHNRETLVNMDPNLDHEGASDGTAVFALRARMESFVPSGSTSSSFLSTDVTTDSGTSLSSESGSSEPPETPLVEIDTSALSQEVELVARAFL